ncbi:serum paraoxonase/arylesterase 2-like [Apostichopus japonicus]|uniref:serum paraoxonase/arylesterase 2-like n=1 Tax=Stichopus japonicus TaxID=307972 RepID=UPI003AB1D723
MWWKIIILGISVVLAWRIMGFVYFMGPHRTIHTHWPGPCRNLAPIRSGAEGIALSSQGLAFISSGYKIADVTDERIKNSLARVFLFDFNKPDGDAKELELIGDVRLASPHGISLWEDKEGIQIFVVDHRLIEDTIEIFRFEPPLSLRHTRTIHNPLFANLNDVIATGDSSFYVTNVASVRDGPLLTISFLLQLSTGSVVYYDGVTARQVAGNGKILNGITSSSDGRFIFVSYMVDEAIVVFRREGDGSLMRVQTISLSAIPDNLFYDPATGDLLASCGIPIGFFTMITDYGHKAPSHLLRIRPLSGERRDNPFETYNIVELFADDGNLLSVSSSAALFQDKLLLGSVLEKAALCEIKYAND